MEEITIQPNETIYETGGPIEYIYFVKKGQVALDLYYVVENKYRLPKVIRKDTNLETVKDNVPTFLRTNTMNKKDQFSGEENPLRVEEVIRT